MLLSCQIYAAKLPAKSVSWVEKKNELRNITNCLQARICK